jgi:hypothetical protein
VVIKPFLFNRSITCTVHPPGGIVVLSPRYLEEMKLVYLFVNYTVQRFLGEPHDRQDIPKPNKERIRLKRLNNWLLESIQWMRSDHPENWIQMQKEKRREKPSIQYQALPWIPREPAPKREHTLVESDEEEITTMKQPRLLLDSAFSLPEEEEEPLMDLDELLLMAEEVGEF